MSLPDVHFGVVGRELNWRGSKFADTSRDDDEPLKATPSDVVGILGFDPLKAAKKANRHYGRPPARRRRV